MAEISVWDKAGREFRVEVPDEVVAGDNGHGQPQGDGGGGGGGYTTQSQGGFTRTKAPAEKQLETFLEDSRMPPELKKKFWALYHKLALIKITNPTELQKMRWQIENLVRAAYLTNQVDDKILTLLDLELLEFDSGAVELSRSIAFDEHPTERELWTMQTINQNQNLKQRMAQSGSGGFLASALNWLKRR
jgi:hypothetical protein